MARVVGIPVSRLFTIVFCLGAALAGFAGVIGAPILSVYPGLDFDMLPLALVVVILGGTGSLLGSFLGSFIIAFLYNYGQALFPELAYFVLFLPMVIVLLLRPQGLFGRSRYERGRLYLARAAAVLLARCRTGCRAATTSTSRARFCSTRSSRSRSTFCSAMAGWCRSATPACSALPATPSPSCVAAGWGHFAAIVIALVVTLAGDGGLRAGRAARDRHRLPDDHAGARPDHLGARLPLDQRHQRRQRPLVAGRPAPFGLSLAHRRPHSTTRRSSSSCSRSPRWRCSSRRRSAQRCAARATSRGA